MRDGGREAERLAAALLQPDPSRRLAAHRALHHAYFASLPPRLRELPDGKLQYEFVSFYVSMFYLCYVIKTYTYISKEYTKSIKSHYVGTYYT